MIRLFTPAANVSINAVKLLALPTGSRMPSPFDSISKLAEATVIASQIVPAMLWFVVAILEVACIELAGPPALLLIGLVCVKPVSMVPNVSNAVCPPDPLVTSTEYTKMFFVLFAGLKIDAA